MEYSALRGTSGVAYYKDYIFLKDGFFCVNGTWAYRTAGTLITVDYTSNVLYYDNLKNPFE